MATKTFKEICVEYAHQLGKGLPLTPAEMCNAVIMYLNAQITEMQGITTALQTAVSEAESSATEAINKADDVSETVNALPKVPTPTTSDNGKVIGVQSGAYALIEQSGGTSYVGPTFTSPSSGVYRTTQPTAFDDLRAGSLQLYGSASPYGDSDITVISYSGNPATSTVITYGNSARPIDLVGSGERATYNGITILTENDAEGFVNVTENQTIHGNKIFTENVDVAQGTLYVNDMVFAPTSGGIVSFVPPSTTSELTISLPDKNGIVALTSDIPDITNLVTTNTEQNITATKTFNDIKVGLYELTSEGFEYSGANLVRYSASGREIRYGLSGYNSTVIGSNVKLNSDFNTSYINCTSNNIILGNSNTAINILGTRLTYNGADILTAGSGGSNYHLHNISLYTSSTESYLREAQLIITNTSSEPFTYDTLLNYLNGTNPRMCIGYANADSFNADVKTRNFIYKNVEYNYIAFCEVKTGDEFDEIKLTELENFEKNYTTVTDIVI